MKPEPTPVKGGFETSGFSRHDWDEVQRPYGSYHGTGQREYDARPSSKANSYYETRALGRQAGTRVSKAEELGRSCEPPWRGNHLTKKEP